jgi:hypothetical protein
LYDYHHTVQLKGHYPWSSSYDSQILKRVVFLIPKLLLSIPRYALYLITCIAFLHVSIVFFFSGFHQYLLHYCCSIFIVSILCRKTTKTKTQDSKLKTFQNRFNDLLPINCIVNFFFCFRYFFSPLPENLSSSCVHHCFFFLWIPSIFITLLL